MFIRRTKACSLQELLVIILATQAILTPVDAQCDSVEYPNGTQCAACPENTYSQVGWPMCRNHTDCAVEYHRMVRVTGNPYRDNKCGNCMLHFVDESGLDGDDTFTTMCSPCEEASPEIRNNYPRDWCQDMVTKEKYQQNQKMLNKSQDEVSRYQKAFYSTLAVFLAAIVLIVGLGFLYIKHLKGIKHPSQASDSGLDAQQIV